MIKALMTGLALVAFLLAGLSVETWRHAKAYNDPIRERWYAFLIMFASALVVALFLLIGNVANAREYRYPPSPAQMIAAATVPCFDRYREGCHERTIAIWAAMVRHFPTHPSVWKTDMPRRWNPTMRPGCGRPNRCGWRRYR